VNFSSLKFLFWGRGISSMYIHVYHWESSRDFRVNIFGNKKIKKFFMFNDQLLFLHLYGNQTIISSSHTILFKLVFFAKV
jgi:hypothetical protein